MMLYIFAPLLFLLSTFCAAQEPVGTSKFNDCHASSTYATGEAGASEFDAKRALQPGTGYWNSAGHHSDDEEVTWTGTMNHAAQLKGVKIRWAYSPEEVQISVSSDGENFHVAVPFKRTPSTDVSFDEDIFFEHPEQVKALTISMRKAIHDYFGINEVTVMGSGQSLLMLISGITSPTGDICLQVEAGKFNTEGTEVVLESCATALAAGDGRELWRMNDNQQLVSARSNSAKCVTLEDGNPEGGGRITLVDCLRALEEADGRSNWNFEANSQLRLLKAGSYCLSQKNVNGKAAGVGDVIRTSGGSAKCSSNADANHGADLAVDGKVETYWASGGFEDAGEHLVNLDIDLGKETKVVRIRIDWEYPAFSYVVSTSKDGQTYAEQSVNKANPANATLDTLGGASAQYVRITMLKPHPRFGKTGDNFVYGIREIHVFANRLQSVVADCREAANSDDARDKYFAESVSEFDPVLAEKVGSMDDDVISRTEEIDELSQKLQELFPQMEGCLTEKQTYDARMHKVTEGTGKVSGQLEEIQAMEPKIVESAGLTAGDIAALPAEDCYVIKRHNAKATSGFYWIEPHCSPEPLRVYCDMKTGSALYVWNGHPQRKPGTLITSTVNSVEDVRLHCAEVGLEPLVLKSVHQLTALNSALRQMGYKLNEKGAIPLAFDYSCLQGHCTGKYHDLLDGVTDETSLMLSKSTSASNSALSGSNAAGLGFNGESISFFDIASSDISAIVCSTNSLENEPEVPHIDITCETTAEANDALTGISNTNVVVECPPGCEEDDSLEVYGSGAVYADKSSICRAAIHFGLIKEGGLVNVALEFARAEYDGSKQNGIESKPLQKKVGRSIRLGPVAGDCPIDMFEAQPSSFLQTNSVSLRESSASKATPAEKQEDVEIDPSVAKVMENILSLIDQLHGVDPLVVVAALEAAAEVVAEARKHLKPAEKMQKAQGSHALELFDSTEDIANTLYDTAGEFYSTLEQMNDRLEELSEARTEEGGFRTFILDYKTMAFLDTWETHDSGRTKHGPSKWGYAGSPVGGRPNALAQTSRILGMQSSQGTYVKLKGHWFFDTLMTVDLYARGSGSIGVAFRMRDFDNLYMLELSQKLGMKRLLKVVDGESFVLAEVQDGGFLEGKWFHVRIETTHGKVNVCVGEAGHEPIEVFSVLDERFLLGSIGFFSSGMKDGVFFDKIQVKAKQCAKISKAAPPPAPRCSHFKDIHFGRFQSVYRQTEPLDAKNGPGTWEYKNNIGGRQKVLAQLNSIGGADEIGTHALLKGHRLCKDGYFSIDFFPECANGVIGAIFRYSSPEDYHVVEVTPSELRARSIVNGLPTTVSRTLNGFSLNKWHSLVLNFEGPTLVAKLSSDDAPIASISSEDFSGLETRDGRVGMTSYNCGGVAFDNIQLSPFQMAEAGEAVPVLPHEKEPWHPCTETVHLLQRRDICHEILAHEPQFRQVSCAQDFCSECCNWHTSLLSSKRSVKCSNECHLNDKLAQEVSDKFMTMITECLKGNGDVFDNCDDNDSSCKLEFCHMCCATSEGSGDMKQFVDLLQGAKQREIEECKFQCKNNIPITQ